MKYHTYILYSKSLDKYYIGQSNNVSRRLWFHNQGLNGYTKRANDWVLVFLKAFNSRSEAIKFESAIKSRKDRNYVISLISSKINELKI